MPPTTDSLSVRAAVKHLFTDAVAQEVNSTIDALANSPDPAVARAEAAPEGVAAVPESIASWWRGDALYDQLGTGRFTGLLRIYWQAPDSFIHAPDPDHPFCYTTAAGWKIQPRLMETDGGSVPSAVQLWNKLSAWGYAPAYIIHDWLFVAHKCNLAPDNTWTFEQTATVMAEAMKTMMAVGYPDYRGQTRRLEKAEDTLYAAYMGVSSFVARRVWDDPTSVNCL